MISKGIPRWMALPAVVGMCFIVLPPLLLLWQIPRTGVWRAFTSESSMQALKLSLQTGAASTLLCIVLGVPIAMFFARIGGWWVRVMRAMVLLPLVLPPVVGGLALLYTFGRYGLVGRSLSVWGIDIAFSTTAVVMAQTFVSLPFLVLSVEGALRTIGQRYEEVAAGLGSSPSRTWWKVTVPLMIPGLLAGAIMAFARALGEFGATITFAGNQPGVTQTAPLAIYVEQINDPAAAVPLSVTLMVIALAVVIAVHWRSS